MGVTMDETKANLAGIEMTFSAPASMAIRHDYLMHMNTIGKTNLTDLDHRLCAAAIGLCWDAGKTYKSIQSLDSVARVKAQVKIKPPDASFEKAHFDVGRFGGQVFDELMTRGATLEEIGRAGGACAMLLLSDFIAVDDTEDLGTEIENAEAFSEAPAGAET